MPLDNTDVTALSALPPLGALETTDLFPVYRPGSSTPLSSCTLAEIASGVGGGGGGGSDLVILNESVERTADAASLNFTTGIGVTDGGAGAETVFTYFPNVRDYGAAGNGSSDDTTAFTTAAAAGVSMVVAPGTYKLTGDVTFPHQVIFLTGAVLDVADGATVTFNGGIAAPVAQIFSLAAGAFVFFSPLTQLVALAEWWGAAPYGAGDYPVASPTWSDAAIQAAIDSGAASVQLMGGDYYIEDAISILVPNFTLRGVSSNQSGSAGASRLVINSATIDGLVIGPASQPGGALTTYLEHVAVRCLTINRSAKPTSLSGNVPGSPTGMRVRWTVCSIFEDIVAQDHSNGFYVTGTVFCKWINCKTLRNLSANGSDWDYWQGFSQDNSPTLPGIVSGNASAYFTATSSINNGGTFPGSTWGHRIYGGFSDTYLNGFESGLCAYGVEADGTGVSGTGPTNEDLKIVNCVLDANSTAGILIHNLNYNAQVLIANNYVAASAGDGIAIDGSGGLVSIIGNQIWGTESGVTGLSLTGSTVGVTSVNNIFTDCSSPIVLNGAGVCQTQDAINNSSIDATAGVYLTGDAFRCVVRPVINGNANGRVGIGVKVDTGVGYCEVNCSGINPGTLTSGSSANKLTYGGTQVTSAGTFGSTNLASGLMN